MDDNNIDRRISVAETKIDHLNSNHDRLERSAEKISDKVDAIHSEVHETTAIAKQTAHDVSDLRDEMRQRDAHLESQMAKQNALVQAQVAEQSVRITEHMTHQMEESLVPVKQRHDANNRKFSWLVVALASLEIVGATTALDRLPIIGG